MVQSYNLQKKKKKRRKEIGLEVRLLCASQRLGVHVLLQHSLALASKEDFFLLAVLVSIANIHEAGAIPGTGFHYSFQHNQ
jgi:hypothetical protein